MKRNRFSKALKHLKSTELDEKLQRLNEAPTNSIGGVYALNPPGFRVGIPDPAKVYYPDIDGNWPEGIPGTPGELSYTRPAGYWSGGSDWERQIATDFSQNYLLTDSTGRSTSGLIAEDGTVLAQLPPDSKSFILGPIVDGYVYNHGYDDYTNIGYIQKDTRQFVLLARIQGHWSADLRPLGRTPRSWNGTSGQLTIYNENFTLAMAEWVRDEILADGYTTNVPYFYSGGVPQVPQGPADCPNCPPGMYGGNGVGGTPFGQGGNPSIGSRQGDPTKGGPEDAGFPWELFKKGLQKFGEAIKDSWENAKKTVNDVGKAINDPKKAFEHGMHDLGQEMSKLKDLNPSDFKKVADSLSKSLNNYSNNNVADFSAYKAGGGDAKVQQGYTKQQVIDIGKQNLNQYDGGSRSPNPYTLSSQEKSQLKQIQQQQGFSAARDAQVNLEIGKLQNLDKAGKLTPQLKLDLLALQANQGYSNLAKGAETASDIISTAMLARSGAGLAIKGGSAALTAAKAFQGGTRAATGLARGTRATVGSTGLDFKGFQAITQGKPYVPSSKPQILGTGAYSAPKVGKAGGPLGGTGAAKYSGTQGSLGGTKQPGGVVQTIVPGGARKIGVIEPQAKVPAQTFDKGAELARKLADPNYRSGSALADKLRQQAAQAGFKPGQTNIPYSELPKVTGTGKVGAAAGAGLGVAGLDAGESEGVFRVKPSWTLQQSANAATSVSDFQTILQDTGLGLGKGYSFSDLDAKKSGGQVTVLKDGKPVILPDGKPAVVTFHSIDNRGNFTSHGSGNQTAGNNLRTVINKIKEITPATQRGVTVTSSKPGSTEKAKFTDYKSGSGPKPKTGTQSTFSSWSKAAGKAGKIIKFSYEVDGTLLSENYNPYTKSDLRKIRGVKSFIWEQESVQPTPTSEPVVPPLDQSSPEYKGQGMTTGEKPTNYSTSRLTYLQKIDTPGKDGFISGFLSGSTPDELQAMFKGTNINSSSVYSMLETSEKYWDLNSEYSRKSSETWAKNNPLILIGIDRMRDANSAKDMGAFYSALAEVDKLFEEYYAWGRAAEQASSAWIATITRLGDYIRSGKINPMDPFHIEDPTIAADKKQKEERDRETQRLIAELQAASSADAQAASLKKLAAIGLGAVVIAVAIVGLALLAKPALISRLGMPFVQRILSAFGKNADDLASIGAKADMGAGGIGKLTGQLADDAASLINKLLKTDVSGAKTLANQIDDAAQSGNTELVKKLMQQADDLLYGKVTPRSKPASSEPHPGTTGPVYQGAHRGSPGPYPYRIESSESQDQVLTESRRRILREVKKPYKLSEQPKQKYKMNFKGKFSPQNTPDVTSSKKSDEMVKSQNAAGQTWRTSDRYWKGYETVERMNILYDNIGHGSQYWDMIVNENQNKKGWRDREVQEQLNMIAHEKAMIRENPLYESPFQKQLEEQETMRYDNDPLFKKVSKRLRKEIDYDKKPSKLGYPNNPPPEQQNGWHPEYGQRDAYYNRLDPQSANAMPNTGNEKIDAKIEKARKVKKGSLAKAIPPEGA